MTGNIAGDQNPRVGTTCSYEIKPSVLSFVLNGDFEWYLYKKQKNGSWKDITGKPKTGEKVTYNFGEIALGVEFQMKVYEIKKGILPGLPVTRELAGSLIIVPISNKVPKIDKVVLFNRGTKDFNTASYRDTLIAQAHCIAMFNKEIEFHLWEDDAPGKGHDAGINKNNRHIRSYKARVNEKGIAEVSIHLMSDEKILRQMSNQFLMKGDRNEGANHEYYVTATYSGQIQGASQVNVDVVNPDYKGQPQPKPKPQPEKHTPKFPVGPEGGPKQPDPKGNIIEAVFIDDTGKELSKVAVGDKVRVRIHSKNMVGKHIQYVIWKYDSTSTHEVYRSAMIKIPADVYDTSGFIITKVSSEKGIGFPIGNLNSYTQNYFIEIISKDLSAESQKFGVNSDGLMEMEKVKSAVVVQNTQNPDKPGSCICQEQYKDLVWGGKVSCEFRKKVVQIAKNLELPQENYEGANWLMTIIALESAYSFSPKCGTFWKNPDENSKYKYIGLIQFGKAAAEEIGTTRTHLMSLSAEQQLDYVEKHFKKKMYKNLLKNRTALYLAVNYPNSTAHASEKNYVVYDSTKDAYDDNSMFKRETHEFWIDKNGKKQFYKGKEGKSYVWEFEEALKEVEELGRSNKTMTFTCGNNSTKNDSVNAKDIVTYHIYHDNKIEKHIPKKIKEGNETRYKYVYHDSKGNEHEITTVDWHTTKEKGVGQVYNTKPTHSKVLSDQNVSEGNTSRRVKYENGDIAEYGTHPKKGIIWLLYKAGKNNVELIKMPDSLNYKKDDVSIAYRFSKTQRRYTGADSFAGFIGYLAKSGYKLTTTGSCFSEGSSFPSQEHCNGRSVDTLYLGIVEQDQKVIDSAIFFHFTEVLKGINEYCQKLKRAGNGGSLHNSHLHSGNFNSSVIKTIKEK
ncbi:hypothetical protein [Chryseobacterium cucumeris]|uniref:hypothetical protein n=1 Tax=Chryseobacterium cucumeris TaxID=1813611 RepID=UPI00192E2C61|nr:hypothetical protein [Chryseobacterium cucumeris]QRA42204.1 hypothetical protein JNG87_16460 [Chryseobacterium cucumeris]